MKNFKQLLFAEDKLIELGIHNSKNIKNEESSSDDPENIVRVIAKGPPETKTLSLLKKLDVNFTKDIDTLIKFIYYIYHDGNDTFFLKTSKATLIKNVDAFYAFIENSNNEDLEKYTNNTNSDKYVTEFSKNAMINLSNLKKKLEKEKEEKVTEENHLIDMNERYYRTIKKLFYGQYSFKNTDNVILKEEIERKDEIMKKINEKNKEKDDSNSLKNNIVLRDLFSLYLNGIQYHYYKPNSPAEIGKTPEDPIEENIKLINEALNKYIEEYDSRLNYEKINQEKVLFSSFDNLKKSYNKEIIEKVKRKIESVTSRVEKLNEGYAFLGYEIEKDEKKSFIIVDYDSETSIRHFEIDFMNNPKILDKLMVKDFTKEIVEKLEDTLNHTYNPTQNDENFFAS